jgi:hypothetical protein
MIFSVEALQANEGDSLLVHYGATAKPRFMVVDGGPSGVFRERLRKRLEALRARWYGDEPLPIELLLVSHMDDDHIRGVLDLFAALVQFADDHRPPPFRVKEVWHDTIQQVAGDPLRQLSESINAKVNALRADAARGLQEMAQRYSQAAAASFGQSEKLVDLLRRLSVPLNTGVSGPITRENSGTLETDFGEGLSLKVLAPSKKRIEGLIDEWNTWLARSGRTAAELKSMIAAYTDRAAPNLSSIVVLAELDAHRALLTGDARGDDILEGLTSSGLLTGEPLQLDLLKLPHHGSDKNVAPEFFDRVRARHYLISGDGEENNPEVATLAMLTDARGDDEYTMHFTNREGKNDLGPKLRQFFGEREQGKGRRYSVRYREDAAPSLVIDLMDQVTY